MLVLQQCLLWGQLLPFPKDFLHKNDIICFGLTETHLTALGILRLGKNDFVAFACTVCKPLRNTKNKPHKIPRHLPTRISYILLYDLNKQVSAITTKQIKTSRKKGQNSPEVVTLHSHIYNASLFVCSY